MMMTLLLKILLQDLRNLKSLRKRLPLNLKLKKTMIAAVKRIAAAMTTIRIALEALVTQAMMTSRKILTAVTLSKKKL